MDLSSLVYMHEAGPQRTWRAASSRVCVSCSWAAKAGEACPLSRRAAKLATALATGEGACAATSALGAGAVPACRHACNCSHMWALRRDP